MAWAKPLYTKGRIDWAGEILAKENPFADGNIAIDEYFEAVDIVGNWRAIHSYPLQAMKMLLKRRAKRVCPTAIVAQRLKRLASIRLKLRLSKDAGNHPSLSQMQDIGGCRAIVDTVDQVRHVEALFSEALRKNPHRGSQHSKKFDYITNPKRNGYRGTHLVYRFRSDSPEHSCYNGQRVEIQLRSRMQHHWATAVETYSTFTGEAMKSNIGSEEWKRFFTLVSSTIAISERTSIVPGTAASMSEIVPELKVLYTKLNVNNVLAGWSAATKWTKDEEVKDKDFQQAAVYLLVLNSEEFSVTVTPYKNDALANANAHYAKIEKEQPKLQAVLVSVDSVAALRTAYPNYFLDTSAFLKKVEQVLNA